jgi:hypothetical protein
MQVDQQNNQTHTEGNGAAGGFFQKEIADFAEDAAVSSVFLDEAAYGSRDGFRGRPKPNPLKETCDEAHSGEFDRDPSGNQRTGRRGHSLRRFLWGAHQRTSPGGYSASGPEQ